MRPGWNPVRRNRHIGTKAQGHGQDNRHVIPESWHRNQCYYEQLCAYREVIRELGTKKLLFLVEPTRPDWFYPCSIDDICRALSLSTKDELGAFDFIVLRQPTRKQRILCPVWGRAMFIFDVGAHSGAAIVIEAQNLAPIKWNVSLNPEQTRELERHRSDGHRIVRTRRGISIVPSLATLRNTVLHRTLFHELGHHIDYNRSSSDEWSGKTKSAKEDFVHRFAKETSDRLFSEGALPFAPIIDDESLALDRLQRSWFDPAS